jgi:hypothetical protein
MVAEARSIKSEEPGIYLEATKKQQQTVDFTCDLENSPASSQQPKHVLASAAAATRLVSSDLLAAAEKQYYLLVSKY